MEENKSLTEDENRKKAAKKRIIISASAGIAAMLLFLAACRVLKFFPSTLQYEGAGKYRAAAFSDAGLLLPYSEAENMSIELFPDGKCTVFLGTQKEKGRWERNGSDIILSLGSRKFTGRISDTGLSLSPAGEKSGSFELTKEMSEKPGASVPAGEWSVISVDDGQTVYSSDILSQTGYGDGYLEIRVDGTGSGELMGERDDNITVSGEFIIFNGRLMKYSFDERLLTLEYADGVSVSLVNTKATPHNTPAASAG